MKAIKVMTLRNWCQAIVLLLAGLSVGCASAPSPQEADVIDAKVDAALTRFKQEVKGVNSLLQSAKGTLVFPEVIQGGFWVGGEYGKGSLLSGGRTVDYYSIASASFGPQIGAQKKDIILLFMNEQALQSFRNSPGWTAGVDGTVAVVNVGAEGAIDTATLNRPILAFVVGQTGLMAGATLEGSKITKL